MTADSVIVYAYEILQVVNIYVSSYLFRSSLASSNLCIVVTNQIN